MDQLTTGCDAKCADMADEISLASDLKQSLERTKWKECGVHGFLIGRRCKGRVYVLNVWVKQSSHASTSNDLRAELSACQSLCAGTDIVGVIMVVKSSKQSDVEKYLESLPPEVQASQSAAPCVVCTIQTAESPHNRHALLAFHQYSAEDKSLRPLNQKPLGAHGLDGPAEQVIFRIQAKLPMKLQLDNSQPTDIEVWGEKMSKAFANVEGAISSGGYTYGFRNTHMFLSEGSVIGTKSKIVTVQHLCNAVASDADSPASKKDSSSKRTPVFVDMYEQVSGESEPFSQPTCAPAIHIRSGSYRFLKLVLPVDVVVEVDGGEQVGRMQEVFSRAITSQLQAMQHCLQQHQSTENEFYTPEPFHFSIPQRHACVTVVYPRTVADNKLVKRRQCLHEKMCLGLDTPVFKRANARVFPGQRAEGGYIINPHLGLAPSKVVGGTPHLVGGNYSYHHYMQDRFDDDKWGCAYRSLQTVVSWFRFQGYTDKPVPSHREIQQALVAVGDKETNFVGSKKWIGSFEVSFCLDHLLGVTSKFLNVSAGAELASKGRELAQHFDTHGTPIMIGGGVLAHTILGVDYSESSGDIKFLILDPHYTGGEDLPTIQREGWCGWKGPDFWNTTAHYNLCMPQRPTCF